MKKLALLLPLALAALALAPTRSLAEHDDDDDDRKGGERQGEKGERKGGEKGGKGGSVASAMANPGWAQYQAECGSCHLAFPPGMLPRASWQKMLGTLDAHFGQNAEVDVATRAQLDGFLGAFAGPATGQAPQRITELAWFKREHDEVSARIFARKSIGSAANCAACHTGAEKGDYGERGIRIPAETTAAASPKPKAAGTR
jgi:cytochrome c553